MPLSVKADGGFSFRRGKWNGKTGSALLGPRRLGSAKQKNLRGQIVDANPLRSRQTKFKYTEGVPWSVPLKGSTS